MEPEREELAPLDADLEVVVARLLAVTGVAHERQAQLQQALESRIVIEQAKGVLSERYGISLDEAFDVLRRAARATQQRLHALAGEVASSRQTPAAIAAAISARR